MNTAQTAAPATREYHRHQASRHAAIAALCAPNDVWLAAKHAALSTHHAAEALMALPSQTNC